MAAAQSHLANEIIKRVTDNYTQPVGYYMLPTYSSGNLTDLSSLSRKELDYWRDLTKYLDTKYNLYFMGPNSLNAQVTSQFADKMTSYFKNRKMVLWDCLVPMKESDFTFLRPYEGRERNLDRYLEGVVIVPQAPYFEQTLFTIFTAFDYLQSPVAFEPDTSLKASLIHYLEDERISDDLIAVFEMVSVSNAFSDKVSNNVWAQKMNSRGFFEELGSRSHRIENADVPENFRIILKPFLAYVQQFVDKNKTKQ
jgi:hypothetical protein